MAWRYYGRAKVSNTQPVAFAICDRCGMRYNHDALHWQFDWLGPRLGNLRILVCERCLDIPFEHNRPIVVPPDPLPIRNPRPDLNQLGFAKTGVDRPSTFGPVPIIFGTAQETWPQTEGGAMDATAAVSGFRFPPTWIDNSQTLPAQTPVTVIQPGAAQQWIWLYTPYGANIEIGPVPFVPFGQLNISMGPGQAYLAFKDFGSIPSTGIAASAMSGAQPIFVAYQ